MKVYDAKDIEKLPDFLPQNKARDLNDFSQTELMKII